jgi:hypothetical protein
MKLTYMLPGTVRFGNSGLLRGTHGTIVATPILIIGLLITGRIANVGLQVYPRRYGPGGASIGGAMTEDPVRVEREEGFRATRANMRKGRFGGEPSVAEGGKLVGVIITNDILEAFVDGWGVEAPGAARIDIVSDQAQFDFGGALAIIAEQGAEILGLGTYREKWDDSPVFYIRSRSLNPEHVAEVLRIKGYNVLGVHFS